MVPLCLENEYRFCIKTLQKQAFSDTLLLYTSKLIRGKWKITSGIIIGLKMESESYNRNINLDLLLFCFKIYYIINRNDFEVKG